MSPYCSISARASFFTCSGIFITHKRHIGSLGCKVINYS
uniref:Uncharacterized protein n=1 Tax=Siphoviridae sp. ctfeV1 TaxID=2826417 RepID=A0A8S5MRG0_9CAUD|nr:MAG TPA: hypothetical protein [Siphoviridae sp. ctfeV1]DAZ36022.1 MAG TPA: hypothetical protein [Caudoviricetes sp.]